MANSTMVSTTRQTKYWLEVLMPSLTTVLLLAVAFFIASMIVLSTIPLYLGNTAVERTRFIRTTVQLNNFTLSMNQSVGKRDLSRLLSPANTTEVMTLDQEQLAMNASIRYALEQQLQAGDNQDRFNIQLLQITPYTSNPSNMSVTLNLLITYTKECLPCDQRRQAIIFRQLCSNNRLSNTVQFLITYSNLSYTLSSPVIVYSSYIPIGNIAVITQILSASQLNNPAGTTQMSNQFLASNYTLILSTSKNNYIATLDEVVTQNSASPNDGPVPLLGAPTMYPELTQLIARQTQLSNTSSVLNITINDINLQFWYSNSTVRILMDFLIIFSTSCDSQCTNQRSLQLSNQLRNLTNVQVHVQPGNLTDGQVRIRKNGTFILYRYSLTTQVISNFTGTITLATPPTLITLY